MKPIKDTPDTLEKQLEKALKYRIERLGGMCIKLVPIIAGLPDRLVVYQGRVYFVELKRGYGKGRLSECQKVMLERLKQAGANVRVLYGATDCNEFLQELIANSI